MTDICACGDVFDEHDPLTMECCVDDCPCIHYEDLDIDEEPS